MQKSEPEEPPATAADAVPGIWDAVRKGDTADVLAQLASGASIDETDSEGENGGRRSAFTMSVSLLRSLVGGRNKNCGSRCSKVCVERICRCSQIRNPACGGKSCLDFKNSGSILLRIVFRLLPHNGVDGGT